MKNVKVRQDYRTLRYNQSFWGLTLKQSNVHQRLRTRRVAFVQVPFGRYAPANEPPADRIAGFAVTKVIVLGARQDFGGPKFDCNVLGVIHALEMECGEELL